jgi:hypothetical protein
MTPIISIQLAILAQAGYYCEGAGCLSRLYGNHREGSQKNEWDRDAGLLGFRQGRPTFTHQYKSVLESR